MTTDIGVLMSVGRALGSLLILGAAMLGLVRIAKALLLISRPPTIERGGLTGHPSGTATATLMFTDIVESTELIARYGDVTADRFRIAHFGLLREAVAASHGIVVKTLGDGLMVAFTSTVESIECAVAMQAVVAEANSMGDAPFVGLRVGISVGDTNVDGSDYFGTPVVEAARLCALADAGQILASDLVRQLAGSRSRHLLRPRGGRQLKGLASPLSVCEVVWGEPASVSV